MKERPVQMPKRSRSSKRLQTAKAPSQTPLTMQQEQPEKQTATLPQQADSSMLSEDQLSRASSTAYLLAMLDALSMVQRRSQDLKLKNQVSMGSKNQQA